MGKVRDMQQKFRDYYNNMLQGEIDSKKTSKGKEKYIKAQKLNTKIKCVLQGFAFGSDPILQSLSVA